MDASGCTNLAILADAAMPALWQQWAVWLSIAAAALYVARSGWLLTRRRGCGSSCGGCQSNTAGSKSRPLVTLDVEPPRRSGAGR